MMNTLDVSQSTAPGVGFENGYAHGTLQMYLSSNITNNVIHVGTKETTGSTNTVSQGAAHTACYGYDGSGKAAGVTITLDGTAQTMQVYADTLTGTISSPAPLPFGALANGASGAPTAGYFAGIIAHAHIWNRLLSAADQVALTTGKLQTF